MCFVRMSPSGAKAFAPQGGRVQPLDRRDASVLGPDLPSGPSVDNAAPLRGTLLLLAALVRLAASVTVLAVLVKSAGEEQPLGDLLVTLAQVLP